MNTTLKKLALWNIWLTVFGVMVGGGMLAVYWRYLPPQVPLLYSRPWGEDQLANPLWLILLPVMVIVVGIGSTLAASHMPKNELLLGGIVVGTSMVFNFIVILALIRVIMLVL